MEESFSLQETLPPCFIDVGTSLLFTSESAAVEQI